MAGIATSSLASSTERIARQIHGTPTAARRAPTTTHHDVAASLVQRRATSTAGGRACQLPATRDRPSGGGQTPWSPSGRSSKKTGIASIASWPSCSQASSKAQRSSLTAHRSCSADGHPPRAVYRGVGTLSPSPASQSLSLCDPRRLCS
jgi:hypothetical protein